MTWSNKAKVSQDGNNEPILTPDGQQILVGADEDLVLLYQIAFNNWNLKSKSSSSWSLKSKTTSSWSLKNKVES